MAYEEDEFPSDFDYAGAAGRADSFAETPSGIGLRLGQIWKELDGRFSRTIEVIGWDPAKEKVQIKGARVTWASVKRFSGKHGGYEFIREGS